MFNRLTALSAALAFVIAAVLSFSALTDTSSDGVIRVKSAHPVAETIVRIKKDIADKGIMFFSEVDQSKLAAGAGITLRPSVLLTFGKMNGTPPAAKMASTFSAERYALSADISPIAPPWAVILASGANCGQSAEFLSRTMAAQIVCVRVPTAT